MSGLELKRKQIIGLSVIKYIRRLCMFLFYITKKLRSKEKRIALNLQSISEMYLSIENTTCICRHLKSKVE